MTKQELQAALTEKGIQFDKRWAEPKLQAALDAAFPVVEVTVPEYSDADLKRIADEITGVNATPIEETLKLITRENGEARTLSGLVIPPEFFTNHQRTEWKYRADCTADKCVILRRVGARTELVREYSKTIHGENFKRLADGFVDKNN